MAQDRVQYLPFVNTVTKHGVPKNTKDLLPITETITTNKDCLLQYQQYQEHHNLILVYTCSRKVQLQLYNPLVVVV